MAIFCKDGIRTITMYALVISAVILLLPILGIELPEREAKVGCILSIAGIDTSLGSEDCAELPVAINDCKRLPESPVIDNGRDRGLRLINPLVCEIPYTPFKVYYNK